VAKNQTATQADPQVDRRTSSDRRTDDRRQDDIPVAENRRKEERRVQRRRQIDPTTCERDYSQDEIEFMRALDDYKRANGRMFPTCSEILEVIRDLGYQRVTDTNESPAELTAQVAHADDTDMEEGFED
tara:strand:- start:149 stop:535 length:387 start_codon:yes stop_codon:yes gene_type:complete